MKLSFDWLCDYVDLSGLTPEEVAEKLTMGAFEVEEISKHGGNGITGDIVVGEILDIRQHPDAEKIRLTTIRIAPNEEPRQIVCGAWNIEVGHRIPVALPGAKVLNRHDGTELKIKESKIRGQLSCGMLCSAPELGIDGSGEGILLLDATTPVGSNAKDLLGIGEDSVMHVAPRSNRGDALSVLGLAREVAALCGRPLREPHWFLKQDQPQTGDPFKVDIETQDDCQFFSIRILTDVKVGPSPEWIVRRLEAIGVRSINNVVDITNYVMHELGQPLHAYDLARLQGQLKTRRARDGEKLTTIDDRERELTGEVMVIADAEKPVGVAGVMGGKGSEITDATTMVALEAAAFNSVRVRRSSRLLGLSSDSSQRFERGVDVASVRKASDRAAYLMIEHCGARLGTLSVAGSEHVAPLTVPLRLSEVTRLCDIEVDGGTVEKLLAPLGFTVKHGIDRFGEPLADIGVPSFRMKDIAREVDMVEEVVRLYGYERVPESMPKRTIAPPLPDRVPRLIKNALCASGLSEAWTSSLVSLADLSGRGLVQPTEVEERAAMRVLNPLSDEHQALRSSLLPGLIRAMENNQARGNRDVWLFELGLGYQRNPAGKQNEHDTGVDETLLVSGIITGNQQLGTWASGSGEQRPAARDAKAVEFFTLKAALENLFQRLSIPPNSLQYTPQESTPGWFHPSRSCQILFKEAGKEQKQKPPLVIGWLGDLHPAVADAYGLKHAACMFELSVDNLRQAMSTKTRFEEPFNTPLVVRDLTVDLPYKTEQAAVCQAITQFGGKLLRKVELVSVFDLSDEKKSLSYRLVFQHAEQTLTAEQVEETVAKIRNQLTRQLSAEFRV